MSDKPSQLSPSGLQRAAKEYIKSCLRQSELRNALAEASRAVDQANKSIEDQKAAIGFQAREFHYAKPVNIAIGDGAMLRVSIGGQFSSTDALISHERITAL